MGEKLRIATVEVMENPPLIGLTGRRNLAAQVEGTPASLGFMEIETYYSAYANAVIDAGGLPVHLAMDVDPAQYVQHLHGVLLSGGADINPDLYHRPPDPNRYPHEPERDEFEMGLVDAAVAAEVPILGICRGHQLLNVHGGGTLHQHVPEHACFDRPTTEVHEVVIQPGSVLGDLYGPTRNVNSLHHQTADDTAPGLRVTARSQEGGVEGLEHRHLPIVSVQWHPEMMHGRSQDPIFAWLVKQARVYRASTVN